MSSSFFGIHSLACMQYCKPRTANALKEEMLSLLWCMTKF